ncbi:MAG: hypothetical protein OXG38_09880 [Chloroflexi bacterium]|nr:hypothetical protein [Chloroflexota bacterium]
MAQDAISRAELDADQARQETTFTGQVYQVATELRNEMHEMQASLRREMHQIQDAQARQERTSSGAHGPGTDESEKAWRRMQQRMLFVAVLATGLIIGAMQIS